MAYYAQGWPAHCEYFASAAALLLRAGGVPARYVTGYVGAERNTTGRYWIARDRDAHAWVEAWIDDSSGSASTSGRWEVVEATPAAGVPESRNSGLLAAFWDQLSFLSARIVALLQRGDFARIFSVLGASAAGLARNPWAWAGLAFMFIPIAFARHRRRKRRRCGASVKSQSHLANLSRVLQKVDHQMALRGFRRRASETLVSFSRRLCETGSSDERRRAAAEWYQEYARVRYSIPDDAAAVTHLANQAAVITAKK